MTKTITRADLAEAIYRRIGISQAESSELVDFVLDEMLLALESSMIVKLSSFGTFKIRQKKQRIGRNPKTKKEVAITPRKVVTFSASSILTERVNNKPLSNE